PRRAGGAGRPGRPPRPPPPASARRPPSPAAPPPPAPPTPAGCRRATRPPGRSPSPTRPRPRPPPPPPPPAPARPRPATARRPAGVPDAHGIGMVATDLAGPYVPCAADADWLLLRDPATGALHLVDPATVVLRPVDTVDGARRAAAVDWQPAPESLVTDDPA